MNLFFEEVCDRQEWCRDHLPRVQEISASNPSNFTLLWLVTHTPFVQLLSWFIKSKDGFSCLRRCVLAGHDVYRLFTHITNKMINTVVNLIIYKFELQVKWFVQLWDYSLCTVQPQAKSNIEIKVNSPYGNSQISLHPYTEQTVTSLFKFW